VSSATTHVEIDEREKEREREKEGRERERERERRTKREKERDRDYFAKRKVRFTGFSTLTYRSPSGGINFI